MYRNYFQPFFATEFDKSWEQGTCSRKFFYQKEEKFILLERRIATFTLRGKKQSNLDGKRVLSENNFIGPSIRKA